MNSRAINTLLDPDAITDLLTTVIESVVARAVVIIGIVATVSILSGYKRTRDSA